MTRTTPLLCLFSISHFCEKGRWALDHFGLPYEFRYLAPVSHFKAMEEMGAPGSSLPALVWPDRVVQGSSQIIDWAEAENSDERLSLVPDAGTPEAWHAIEARLDDVVGVHVRRSYYSQALVRCPDEVLPMFADDLPPEERGAVEESWAGVGQLMAARMDCGVEQGRESVGILETELDWFDGLLADGRRFIAGDRFSRLDLTAASMWAAIALPKQHPTYHRLFLTPETRATLDGWEGRPTIAWTRAIYADYR